MASSIDPTTETRIADLARRLGIAGPDAVERVLGMALDQIEVGTSRQARKMTPCEITAELRELERLSEAGRRWRENNPAAYGEYNPPSLAWQDQLYNGSGLPQ